MSHRIWVKRSKDYWTRTDGWDQFLGAPELWNGRTLERLCEVLKATEPEKFRNTTTLPWPTLVLGSECLRVPEWEPLGEALTAAAERCFRFILADQELEPALEPGVSLHDKVMSFVCKLIWNRTNQVVDVDPPDLTDRPNRDEEARVDWSSRTVVVAALLNLLYFDRKTKDGQAVSRSEYDKVPVGEADTLSRALVTEVQRLQQDLRQNASRQGRRLELISALQEHLTSHPARISLGEVAIVTQMAWEQLTSGVDAGLYPEWQDLLFDLSLHGEAVSPPMVTRRPWRLVAHDGDGSAAGVIRHRLLEPTHTSARNWANKPVDPREAAWAEYAELVQAMARYRSDKGSFKVVDDSEPSSGDDEVLEPPNALTGDAKGGEPIEAVTPSIPPAVVFVTSFDIELELALVNRDPAEPFTVLLPVELMDNEDPSESVQTRGTLMWMGCVLNGPHGDDRDPVKRILAPRRDSWFVVGAEYGASDKNGAQVGRVAMDTPIADAFPDDGDHDALALVRAALGTGVGAPDRIEDLPIVVHLMGAPQLELPLLVREQQTAAGINHPVEGALTPLGTVLLRRAGLKTKVDEAGLTHWTAGGGEALGGLAAPVLRHATLLDENNALRFSMMDAETAGGWGLPHDLTRDGKDAWRYWVMLGVEFSDPVLRGRVLSHMLAAGLGTDVDDFRGVAVNATRLDDRAADLLAWCGFQMVTDREFRSTISPQLAHYRAHLDDGPISWPQIALGGRCRMPREDRSETEAGS